MSPFSPSRALTASVRPSGTTGLVAEPGDLVHVHDFALDDGGTLLVASRTDPGSIHQTRSTVGSAQLFHSLPIFFGVQLAAGVAFGQDPASPVQRIPFCGGRTISARRR